MKIAHTQKNYLNYKKKKNLENIIIITNYLTNKTKMKLNII